MEPNNMNVDHANNDANNDVNNNIIAPTYAARQHAVIPDAPLWAQQFFDALTVEVSGSIDDLTNQVRRVADQLEDNHRQMDREFFNAQARFGNAMATRWTDALMALYNGDGHIPPGFPARRSDFHALTDEAVTNLLQFYGVPFEPGEDCGITRHRLCQFSGIPD